MQTRYRYLFGPVPSRRFGRSLGVDLTPFKTCCQDCVFCQLGRTTHKTIDRKEYVPTGAVLAEIKRWLASGGRADYITLSGSGEPTLHTGNTADQRSHAISSGMIRNYVRLFPAGTIIAHCGNTIRTGATAHQCDRLLGVNSPK